jgi:two-component system sensor histidine kinase TctE
MRTPLSILRAHVAVLRAAPPGSVEARQSIDDIETGAGRLGHLLVQLLALARADNAATAAPRLEPIDLRVILVRVVEDRREAAARAGVSLVLEAPSGIVVETAEALAAEMLGNLVDNALGHGGTGGIVTITARLDRRVTIDDRGPGIPRGDRDRVFARFARLAPYGDVGGTGLGLSIARALSQAIGAELRLLDGPGGRGLRAEILFPAAG